MRGEGHEACRMRHALMKVMVLTIEVEMAQPEGLWKVREGGDECLCSLSLDDRLFARVQVCLFKKFEDEDRTRLSWIGVDLRAGAGVGVGGRTRSGSSKSSPHHLGRWQGSVLRTFHSWCAKGRGLEGELLSGMQGPSPQGATAKGTKSPPRTKSFGAVPIGGRSKWAGTGTWRAWQPA